MADNMIRCSVSRSPSGAFSDRSRVGSTLGWALQDCPQYKPPVDVAETSSHYLITMEAPGIDMDSLNITFSNGLLDIKGEKLKASEVGECCHCSERYAGTIERRFRMFDVDEEKIDATYRDGILKVKILKKEGSQPVRKIEVH